MRRRDFIRYLGLGSVAVTIPEAMTFLLPPPHCVRTRRPSLFRALGLNFNIRQPKAGIGMKHWPILLPTNGAGRCLKSVRSVWSIWF